MESAAARPRPVLTSGSVLPEDADRATLVARVHAPEHGGPCVAAVRGERVVDLTAVVPTVSDLWNATTRRQSSARPTGDTSGVWTRCSRHLPVAVTLPTCSLPSTCR